MDAEGSRFSHTLSSAAKLRSFILNWNAKKLLVPIGRISNTLHRAINWGLDRESKVISSSNNLQNFRISALEMGSPVSRT